MRRKEKIALIGPYPPPYGGISVHMERLLKILPQYSYTLYCTTKSRPEGSINFYGKQKIFNFILLLFTPYKIIHVHSTDSLSRLLFGLMGIFRKNIYLHMHGVSLIEFIARKKGSSRLLKFLIRYLNILAVNEDLAKNIKNFQPRSVQVVDPFLPPEINQKELIYVREKYNKLFSTNNFILSMTGWFDLYQGKDLYGFDLAAEMIFKLKEKGKNVFLVACINGIRNKDLYEKFRKYLRDKNIEDRIILIFDSGQVWPYILLSDIFIRPTCTDGSSVSIQEALWTDTSVIASDCVIRPGEVTLFKDRNPDDLFEKINDNIHSTRLSPEEKLRSATSKMFLHPLLTTVYFPDGNIPEN